MNHHQRKDDGLPLPVVIGIGFALIVLLATLAVMVAKSRNIPLIPAEKPTSLADGKSDLLLKAMEKHFPTEVAAVTGPTTWKPVGETTDEATLRTQKAFGRTFGRHRSLLNTAPSPELNGIRMAFLVVLENLKRTAPQKCAEMTNNGIIRDIGSLPEETKALLYEVQLKTVLGIAAGRDRPVKPRSKMLATDVDRIIQQMRRNNAPVQAIDYLQGKVAPSALSDLAICEAEIEFLRTIDTLPADAADRVLATIYGIEPSPPKPGAS